MTLVIQTYYKCKEGRNIKKSPTEVKKAIRELKNGKACGCDAISNEMLKLSTYQNLKYQ